MHILKRIFAFQLQKIIRISSDTASAPYIVQKISNQPKTS